MIQTTVKPLDRDHRLRVSLKGVYFYEKVKKKENFEWCAQKNAVRMDRWALYFDSWFYCKSLGNSTSVKEHAALFDIIFFFCLLGERSNCVVVTLPCNNPKFYIFLVLVDVFLWIFSAKNGSW